MRKSNFIKAMMLSCILPLSTAVSGNDDNVTTNGEEKVIELTNDGNIVNTETLQVPVTATVSNNLLNVQFTGNIPTATISVQNALTGATVNRQTLTGVQGVTFSVPV
ncbi:MAG: DUF3244 domain-containing protein, partial [Bacteroidaceae bacterium]|nr:DUF3244 domain-containing protein [Bacteroidaceae bacterium]